jgi:predicted solute-binding protein
MAQFRGQVTTLLASAVQSASGTKAITGTSWNAPDKATILLNVSASSSPTTLDLYLQTSTDAGTTWYDVAHFTQVGAVATSIQAAQWCRIAPAANNDTSVIVTGDAALAAAKVVNGPVADNWMRLKWVLAGTSYTFAVLAILDRDL